MDYIQEYLCPTGEHKGICDPVENNKDILKPVESILCLINIVKVRGHKTNLFNNKVDHLATKARIGGRKKYPCGAIERIIPTPIVRAKDTLLHDLAKSVAIPGISNMGLSSNGHAIITDNQYTLKQLAEKLKENVEYLTTPDTI